MELFTGDPWSSFSAHMILVQLHSNNVKIPDGQPAVGPWTFTMWLAAFHSCLYNHVYAWHDYYIIIRYILLPSKLQIWMWYVTRYSRKTLTVSESRRCTCYNKDMLLHVWDHKKTIISKLCQNSITRIKMGYMYILHESQLIKIPCKNYMIVL